jgi:hypothetical protein
MVWFALAAVALIAGGAVCKDSDSTPFWLVGVAIGLGAGSLVRTCETNRK